MGTNGPNLQDLFNQRFGAGSYEAGVNNAYNAGRAIYTAKQQAIQQQMFEQYQKQMEAQQKAAAAAQAKQQAAQDKLNKPLLDQQKAYNFWLGPDGKAGSDLLQKGAYRSVKDIQDDPMIQAKLKSEGYDLQALYDQAYNVASGKATNPGSTQNFASAKAFNGFEKDLSDSTKDERKQNLSNWDADVAAHQAQVQAQQDARNSPSFFDRAKALGGEALDFLGRPLNAVETGISDTLNGGNFLQGAKEGLLGQRHTSGTQLLSQIGLDPNKNDTSKVLSRLLGNAVISKLPLGSQVAPWLSNTLKQNIGQQTAGYGVDTALDPLNALIGAGEVSNLAKGSKLLEATNSLKYDPAAFEQALKDSFSPKGNVSNVLADAPKEMPKPFEQKYNIPQLTPQVKPQVNADVLKQSDWFGFGQQGNNLSRGLTVDPTVPKGESGAVRSLADETLNRANTFHNGPTEGFNQRLLNVQQDMKGLQNNAQSIANQHGGTYKPDVESLYQQVKQPNDPKTFDELVKMAQMEHGANNPSLTSMLQQDPKVKAGIDALNSLGKGATKKAETVKQSNVLKGLNIPELKGPQQQNAHELLKAAQVDRSIKPGGNGSLLMPLKPTVLESVKVNKSLHTMSKGELQDIMSKLEKQESLAAGDETKLKAIESDKKKVSDLMMKLDLQQFGANAEKLNPLKAVQEKITGKAPEKTPQEIAQEKAIAKARQENTVKKFEDKGNERKIEAAKLLENSDKWKSKGAFSMGRETMTRNFEDIMGKDAPKMIKKYLDPIKSGEADRVRFLNDERKTVKDFGIKPGSEDDKLVQMYGEKHITLDELKQKTNNWEKVVKVSEDMRNKYDELLTTINKSLKAAGEKEIPKRADYFPHYEEIDGLMHQLGFDMHSHTLPTDINGLSENFKPQKTWTSFAQRRTGDKTSYGFIQGFDKYIEGASNLIYHTENIKQLRSLEDAIRAKYEGDTHLNDFASQIKEYTNQLAGKKAKIDRVLEEAFGRKVFNVVDTLRKRTGANMIGANVSSALTNFIPITQSLATTGKKAFVQGLGETLSNMVKDDGFIHKSDFLTKRIGSDPLYRTLWDKTTDKSMWLMKTLDKFTSQVVVRGKYNELIDKGVPEAEAMKQADEWATKLMAGRSKGDMPTLFGSKTFGILSQFQLEVNNQVSFLMKDLPRNAENKAALASSIGQILVYSYLFNNLYEKAVGRRPAFDPIGIAFQAEKDYTNDNLTAGDATKNLGTNIANQLPFTSILTGGRFPISAGVPNAWGVADGTANLKDEALKPLIYLGLPTGGGQLKKTVEGLTAMNKNPLSPQGTTGVYKNGKLQFPVADTVPNNIRGALFGKYSSPESKDFFDNKRSTLSDKQTQRVEQNPQVYQTILAEQQKNRLKKQMSAIQKDRSLTPQEKMKKMATLIQKLQGR